MAEQCAYEPTFCTKECALALPRGELQGHNCAKELRTVYLRVLEENKKMKSGQRVLEEENKRLLQLVENTADKIDNMEGLINA